MDEYIGIISLFAANYAPEGWALCNGQLLSITQYQALFSILGTTYGGDGHTTFGLPDLRSRVPVGMGQGPGLPSITLGGQGGEAAHTLLVTEMPAHTHAAIATGNATLSVSSGNASQPGATAGASIATPGSLAGRSFVSTLGFNTTAPDTALNSASVNVSSLAVNNAATGGSLPHNNMQPYLGLNYIICVEGLYPIKP